MHHWSVGKAVLGFGPDQIGTLVSGTISPKRLFKCQPSCGSRKNYFCGSMRVLYIYINVSDDVNCGASCKLSCLNRKCDLKSSKISQILQLQAFLYFII